MFSGLPPAQRRLLFLSLGALALAIAFVVLAVIFATGRPAVREGEYEPFEVGDAARLAEAIAREQPLFFADPVGGDRGFALTLDDGAFAALHVVPPGASSDCPIDWNDSAETFEDCRGRRWATDELARFPTSVEDDLVVIDLRTRRAPQASR